MALIYFYLHLMLNILKVIGNMKAKVKATGEIVELYPYSEVYEKQKEPFRAKMHKICHLEGLEIFDGPDYWEKLKHQYAGMAMQGILAANATFTADDTAKWSIEYATALIEKLKNE